MKGKITIELEFDSVESLTTVRDMLNDLITSSDDLDESPGNVVGNVVVREEDSGDVDPAHLNRLREFEKGLSEKQWEVWQVFKRSPGPKHGDELKAEVPFLQPQGALSGVFRATRRWMALGGERETSPFVQIQWDHARYCGVYRGLTEAEVKALTEK